MFTFTKEHGYRSSLVFGMRQFCLFLPLTALLPEPLWDCLGGSLLLTRLSVQVGLDLPHIRSASCWVPALILEGKNLGCLHRIFLVSVIYILYCAGAAT